MDTQQNTNIKLEEEDKGRKLKEQVRDSKEVEAAKVPITYPASASSSPSHEFSFTVFLHSSSTPALENNNNNNNNKAKAPPPSPPFAIDLSPADDIFFHGHLLPLHLLSHLPVSPRSSTNSMDSFTLPIRELLDDQKQKPNKNTINNGSSGHGNSSSNIISGEYDQSKSRSKPKSFSLFRWRKGCEVREREDKEKQKKKLRFEVSHVLKRYLRMVRPSLFFKGRRENMQFHRQPYSFSGNLSTRNKQELRGRRGEFSAPASMRTSPTNSGLLVATATLPSCASDSTMEELQAAIQAAIAHCKNSIAAEDKKIKC